MVTIYIPSKIKFFITPERKVHMIYVKLIEHRLLLLLQKLGWNLLISLLALMSQRAMSGQVLSPSHMLMFESLIVSCNAKYALHFEHQGRSHSIEKVYITLEIIRILMSKQSLLLERLYLLLMKIT